MRTVDVRLTGASYEVRIGAGLLDESGTVLAETTDARKAALLTDDVVADLYADRVQSSIEAAGVAVVRLEVPSGETSKSWSVAGSLLESMARAGLDRRDALVSLGGGVVGDLGGFCAATYMRGISYVQVPTTLLAQVDSSVGGKTAVDLAAGKNLAGAFWQPAMVLADTTTLSDLPEQQWASGMAEIVKSSFLEGEEFVAHLESEMAALRAREPDVVEEVVASCVEFKRGVVASDERESGPREQLNLGHTLAHAIERLAGYEGAPHGIAVGTGLRFAAFLAERVLDVGSAWRSRQESLLDAAGLPAVRLPYAEDELVSAMHADKKSRGGVVRFVFSTGPGAFEVTPVEDRVIAEALALWDSGSV
jgi:3-dehydroquinate synthase